MLIEIKIVSAKQNLLSWLVNAIKTIKFNFVIVVIST